MTETTREWLLGWLLLVAAAALCPLAGAQQLDFEPTTYPFSDGVGVLGIAAADLDGDGDQDLAAGLHFTGANTNNRVALWWNDGLGGMTAGPRLQVPASTDDVVAGDLDGDGDQDLVVANFSPGNSVSIFLNEGGGSFAPGVEISVIGLPIAVELADLDGDQDLDLAVAIRSITMADIGVRLNDGTGSFGPMVVYPVGFGPNDVVAGDFDGDGDLDLASVEYQSETVSVLANDGTGHFGPRDAYPTGFSPNTLSTGDIDGDGNLDLVVTNDLSPFLSYYLGDGSGLFPGRVDEPVALRAQEVVLADFDLDGALDVAFGRGFTSELHALRNLGDGSLAPTVIETTGYDPLSTVSADLDGDGDLDLATANMGIGGAASITVLLNQAVLNSSYCTAGTSASGCQAALSAKGAASATSASGFDLLATGVEGGKDGLFFFGVNGRQASPWGSGTSLQCVVPPVSRAGLMTGTGTPGACDGGFSRDLNALWCPTCPQPSRNPGAGAVAQAQLWYRDPANTSNQTTSLSDAFEFTVVP